MTVDRPGLLEPSNCSVAQNFSLMRVDATIELASLSCSRDDLALPCQRRQGRRLSGVEASREPYR